MATYNAELMVTVEPIEGMPEIPGLEFLAMSVTDWHQYTARTEALDRDPDGDRDPVDVAMCYGYHDGSHDLTTTGCAPGTYREINRWLLVIPWS